MASWHRELKENLRIIKCRFKRRKVLTPTENNAAVSALKLLSVSETVGGENKVIWMFWDSGLESAPDVVKLSHASWVIQNPDYQVILLDNKTIQSQLGFDFFAVFKAMTVDLGAAGKSDLLRLYLLNRFGGIWADATTFCKQSLTTWLDISTTGFFCFREKQSDDRQLVSWFLAAHKGNAIIQDLLQASLSYLTKPRQVVLDIRGLTSTRLLAKNTDLISVTGSGNLLLALLETKYCTPYFWMFYLFNETVKQPQHQVIWQQIMLQNNQYAELDDDFGVFRESVVAKQTYREKYTTQALYQQRYQYMLNLNTENKELVDGK
ncbi:capsular polysaccharide synthesis protein [Photobacterium toruni]|uniref:capsular polysaccharide synthesis protein n=1 Tax=Photobacterium toruni TaxID=1935446 RepID=UPI002E193789|nr:capsular polysaccharide synthesis protein [Photobacterium toruni]